VPGVSPVRLVLVDVPALFVDEGEKEEFAEYSTRYSRITPAAAGQDTVTDVVLMEEKVGVPGVPGRVVNDRTALQSLVPPADSARTWT
jgi:hypothetical protein